LTLKAFIGYAWVNSHRAVGRGGMRPYSHNAQQEIFVIGTFRRRRLAGRFTIRTFVLLIAGFFCVLAGCQQGPAPAQKSSFVLITDPCFVKSWDLQVHLNPGDSVMGIYYLDGTLHVLTNHNFDQAVKSDSGELLYLNQIGPSDVTLHGGPTLVTDGIVFPTSHTLEVFSRQGVFQRSIDLQYSVTNQVVGNHSDVYVGLDQGGGRLAQVDTTQSLSPIQWEAMTFGTVDGAVAVQDNVVYFGSEDGSVRSCLEDRTPYWPLLSGSKFTTDGKILSAVVTDSSNCYFSSTDGKLYCIDLNTGKLRWRYFAGTALEEGPQITDTTVYQYVEGTGLVALDKTKQVLAGDNQTSVEQPFHDPRWTLRRAGRILCEDDKFVYVTVGEPDSPQGIAAVDIQTGQPAFRTHRKDLVFFAADPKAPLFYGATRDGLIVAMKSVTAPGSYGEIADATLDGPAPNAR
jgi:outer membrane protein assembly factor BamB